MNWLDFTLRDSFTDRQTISFSLTPDINEKLCSQLLSLSLVSILSLSPCIRRFFLSVLSWKFHLSLKY